MPDIEDKLTRHHELRIYCEVAPDDDGAEPDAVWEDWKFSFSTWFRWERGAIVTDVDWMTPSEFSRTSPRVKRYLTNV